MAQFQAGERPTAGELTAATSTGIQLIEQHTLTADQQEVDFTNIDQSFINLWILACGGVTGSITREVELQFNGDTGTASYAELAVDHDDTGASGAVSGPDSESIFMGRFGNVGILSSTTITIFGYSRTDREKIAQAESAIADDDAAFSVRKHVGVWHSSAAITSIKLAPPNTAFKAGSDFQLYGLGAAS